MKDPEVRRSIVEHCRKMNASGINQGTSGNISVRCEGGMLITPSGIDYDALAPDDIVEVGLDGSHRHALAPSSEWRIHRDIYVARPNTQAVVHAHPVHCTALAIHGRELPAVHYMIAAAGGPTIRCAPYHTYGTEALSRAALVALEGRDACLLAHHGLLATGRDLARALWLAVEVETLAHQYLVALTIGPPPVLPAEEIARVVEKFKTYGLQKKPDAIPR